MVCLALLLCFVLNVLADPPGGYYHSKYDHLDLDDVLNHKRLVYYYANCLLSRGPCPPQGTDLKRILPEALETTCLRCTEKQKVFVYHIVKRLKAEYPDIWKEISDIWDPTGEYVRKFRVLFGEPPYDAAAPDISTNLLANRFGDDESGNDLAGSVKPSTTTTTTTTPKPRPNKLTPRPVRVTSTTSKPTPVEVPAVNEVVPFPSITVNPSPSIYWWVNSYGSIPPMRWRPSHIVFRPQPSWLGDISTKVIQAGTQVAGMVLSTVQALVGQ